MKDLMIWTDAEAYMGKGIKDPENDYQYNTIEVHTGQRIRESVHAILVLCLTSVYAMVLSVLHLGIGELMVTSRTLMFRGY